MSDKSDNTSKWNRIFSFKNKTPKNSIVKSVLIVDDEKPFLLSIFDGLSAYTEDFHVLTALNGKEAVKILKSSKIDLVVTDLKMPKMNGFELLAYMSKNHSDIPAIVMTAFGTRETENKLNNMGAFQYLEKPLDINILVNNIYNALNIDPVNGNSRGVSLASFLKLIEMESTTCTIKVASDRGIGYLYFDNGEIMGAEAGKLNSKAAALDIINCNNAEIDISFTCEINEKNIESSLDQLLAEASEVEEAKQMTEKAKSRISTEVDEEVRLKAKKEAKLKTDRKESEMNVQKLNGCIESLKKEMGDALIGTSIVSRSDAQAVAEWNSQSGVASTFVEVSNFIDKSLAKGYPALGKYYIMELEGDKLLIVIPLGEYQWGLSVDATKAKLGLFLNVILPDMVSSFEDAMKG